MQSYTLEPELSTLLKRYSSIGGVLDFVFLVSHDGSSGQPAHREAAIAGMAAIDRRLEEYAMTHASKEYPIEMFFRLRWEKTKLTGRRVALSDFWGTDDVDPKPLGRGAWSQPSVNGYKTAFFCPPYPLSGPLDATKELFARINAYVFRGDPKEAEIFSWSTDWSNYFASGHEWWGAFFWTIHPADPAHWIVIGASTTD